MSFIVFVSVGLGLLVGGLYWHLWDDSSEYLNSFVVAGAYSDMVQLIWDMIPVILVILGVLCLVMAGKSSRTRGMVE